MVTPLGVGIDWGSSNIRAWLLRKDGEAIARNHISIGLREARTRGFRQVLHELLKPMPAAGELPIIACGMVGARDGWSEVPYVSCPASSLTIMGAAQPVPDGRLKILPGVVQTHPSADVMRGEETQLIGILTEQQSVTVCLPGTHSKWADAEGGHLTGFRTYVTGDLFAAARASSIFAALAQEAPFDASSFRKGIDDACTTPLTRALFQTRARVATGGMRPDQAYWFLSGLLIGAELLCEIKEHPGSPVVLLADGALRDLYEFAFDALGRTVVCRSSEAATRAGLALALRYWSGD